MGDYDEFTQKLQNEHSEKEKQHQVSLQKANAERDARFNAQVDLLEQVAISEMEEAATACKARGLRPEIVKNWDPEMYMEPKVDFKLFGPKKRPLNDDSSYEIEANMVSAKVEDGKVKVSIAKQARASKIGEGFVGYGQEGVKNALQSSIASYYDEIDPKKF